MSRLYDMHMHSCYSDGEYSPNELISKCIKEDIRCMSLTDHDNINGYKHIDYGKFEGKIELYTGIELSAKASKGRLHILGYGIDINNPYLLKSVENIRRNSFYSMISLLNQIRLDYGIHFSVEEIKSIFNAKHNIGRPDVAKLLVKNGYSKTIKDAFNDYLNYSYDKIRSSNTTKTKEECIEIIKKSNGLAVLAHPNQLLLSNSELEEFLISLLPLGLDGIEVYHSMHKKEEIDFYLYLANKYNLLISGGSDYHGPFVKPNIKLGELETENLTLINELRKRK